MRDLSKDKEYLMTPFNYTLDGYDSERWLIKKDVMIPLSERLTKETRIGIHAIERALAAEDKVAKMQSEIERLKQMVKSITGGLDEAIESNHYLENELDKYKLAFKYACKALEDTELNWFTPGGNSMEFTFLRKAERELERSAD